MAVTEEQFQLIVKHLDQSLSDTELKECDARLDSSEEFRKEVKIMEDIIDSSRAIERASEFEHIKNRFDQFDLERKQRSKTIRMYLSIAASFAILVICGIVYMNNATTNPQELFDENYEVFPVESVVRNQSERLNTGLNLYKNKKYKEAIPFLENLKGQRPVDKLYLSNAYIQVKQYHDAETVLRESLPLMNDPILLRYSHWYLGLTLLAQDKTEEAKSSFNKLADESGPFQNKAVRVLRTIDEQ